MKLNYAFVLILLSVLLWTNCKPDVRYLNETLSFEERTEDLVSRMTLEEKISQMQFESPAIPRLHIQEYNWWNECLHGVGRSGLATVFPQAIGMAAMWDTAAMYNIANAISDEARAKYNKFQEEGDYGIYRGLTFWSPNINIFRDPRWGRGMETYGEDPFLTSQLGVAFIKGLQGNNPKYYKLIATAKHFAVHSGPESSRHSFNVNPGDNDFYETYAPQFKAAVQDAGVYSVMCAYNRYKGEPCCGSTELSSLLRNRWGFEGYIVSDCLAVRDFYEQKAHEVVNTKAEAAAMAVKAGTDLNCGNSYPALGEAIEKGYITEAFIDASVKRLMLARMKLGMFDNPKDVPFSDIPYDVVDSKEHQKLAKDAALKSMVLLKNDKHTLPFNKDIKKLAVIGPNADFLRSLYGNYHGFASNPVTPLKGLKDKLSETEITYALGCPHAEGLPYLTPVPTIYLYTDKDKTESGLHGSYFYNTNLEGIPELTRMDKIIDFDWWDNGPGNGISGDQFSARWTGVLVPPVDGTYTLGFEGHNEMNLWVDGELLCGKGSDHSPVIRYGKVQLKAGKLVEIKLEYKLTHSENAMARFLWEIPGQNLKQQAISTAKDADAVVLCMGLSPQLEGEEMKVDVEGFSGGDRLSLDLPKVQLELIKSITKLGKPTVLVLINGSALAINWEKENVPAILEAWYPGQAGGEAIADILFGEYNPSGRLPVTFYKSANQLPAFEDYNMEGRTYRYFNGEVLYPFGYGLSYTSFEYSNLEMPEQITPGQQLCVSVEVENTGKYDGDEVVQLYVSHPESELRTSIRSLKAFQRIHLKAGEKQTVQLELDAKDLAVLDPENQFIIDGHLVKICVGGGQPNKLALHNRQVVTGKVNFEKVNNTFVCHD